MLPPTPTHEIYRRADEETVILQQLIAISLDSPCILPVQQLSEHFIALELLQSQWEDWKRTHEIKPIAATACDHKLQECRELFATLQQIVLVCDPQVLAFEVPVPQAVPTREEALQTQKKELQVQFVQAFQYRHMNVQLRTYLFNACLEQPELFSGFRYKNFRFGECSCTSRTSILSMRHEAEESIVSFASDTFKDQNNALIIASIGSGELFQDLIILGKLMRAGFKKMKFFCIDDLGTSNAHAKALEALLNQLPGIEIEVNTLTQDSFGKCQDEQEIFDIVYAIDFEHINSADGEGWQSIVGGYRKLKSIGKLFLYAHHVMSMFSKTQGAEDLSGKTQSILASLCQNPNLHQLQQAERVHFACVLENGDNFDMPTLLSLFQCIAKGREYKTIELQLFGPKRENLPPFTLCSSLMGNFYAPIINALASRRFYASVDHTEESPSEGYEHKYHVILIQNKSEFRLQKLAGSL